MPVGMDSKREATDPRATGEIVIERGKYGRRGIVVCEASEITNYGEKYVLMNGKYFHLPYAEDAGGIMPVRWTLQ